jgi:U3 small nucleolar RNA-associated protein 19
MAGMLDGLQVSKKRKKEGKTRSEPAVKRRAVSGTKDDEQSKIQQLEDQIAESRKYYNNIVTLLSMLNVETPGESPNISVAVSLCRVFSRLLAGGHLNTPKGASEQDLILVAWLKERYQDFQNALVIIIRNGDCAAQACSTLEELVPF